MAARVQRAVVKRQRRDAARVLGQGRDALEVAERKVGLDTRLCFEWEDVNERTVGLFGMGEKVGWDKKRVSRHFVTAAIS